MKLSKTRVGDTQIMRQQEKAQRKAKKQAHALVFEAVRSVIHKWDPYGLLETGCPTDEFDSEIQAVIGQIERIGSVQDAVHTLSRVFSSAFEPKDFRPESCQDVGEQLYRTLRERGILKGAQ